MTLPIMIRHWHMDKGLLSLTLLFLALLTAGIQSQAWAGASAPAHAKPLQEIVSPKPVNSRNLNLYRHIFFVQESGDLRQADALMKRLTDFRLRGYILYQRYTHPTAYRPGFAELQDWLKQYADIPGAGRIYIMARNRVPKGFKGVLDKPVYSNAVLGTAAILEQPDTCRIALPKNPKDALAVSALTKDIKTALRAGTPAVALHTLEASGKKLALVDFDRLRGQIALGFLYEGNLTRARRLGLAGAKRSGADAPDAGWAAGLAAWRQNDYKLAAKMFQQVATSPCASGWMASGGAYWASRASMRTGDIALVRPMLEQAASWPRTFYGLIATRALGWDFDFDWSVPEYTPENQAVLAKLPGFQRASALVKIGQLHSAEAELLSINPGRDVALRTALMAYASHANLPGLAMRLAEAYRRPDGGSYDAALYPLSPWKPTSGFRIDEALLHALIRQESRFDTEAQSNRGASGLMQLMPATATDVSGTAYQADHAGRYALKNPQTNLDIGQRYVENLMDAGPVGAELMSLLVAYNAGPGSLSRWKKQYADTLDDPLLFIETIPMAETRDYVEHVMANYWIYRIRLDRPAASLDEVAQGRWTNYALAAQPAAGRGASQFAMGIK